MSSPSSSSLKEKAARGIFWGSLSNGAQQLLNLVFGIVLGRLLSPEDFGMVGMLTIFALIASTLQESGFTAALANRKDLAHRDYNAVFWFCLPVSLTIYALLALCAPLIAKFYATPELVPLARYCFLSFVISGLGIAPSARLFKQLRVKERTQSNLIALLISGIVGIVLANYGFSYWGIATQTLVYVSVNTALYWYFARWRPSWAFDFAPIREMGNFSTRLLITNILSHLNNNFFSIVLGRFYGTLEVGSYNQANKWNYMGNSLVSGVVAGVAQPLFVETQGDADRQVRVFRKMLRFTCFLAFPVMFGLSLIAQDLIVIAIGAKWQLAARILSLLCLSGALLPPTTLYTQFLLSRSRSGWYMWSLAGLVATQFAALIVSHRLGVMTMVGIYVFINLLWMLVWHSLLKRELNVSFRTAARDVLPFLLTAAGTMLITHFSIEALRLSLVGGFFAKIAMAAMLYATAMWLSGAETMRESWHYLRKRKTP